MAKSDGTKAAANATEEAERLHRIDDLEAARDRGKVTEKNKYFRERVHDQRLMFQLQVARLNADNRRLETQVEDLIIDAGEKKV